MQSGSFLRFTAVLAAASTLAFAREGPLRKRDALYQCHDPDECILYYVSPE